MSKADLYKLAENAQKYLAQNSEVIRKRSNQQPHMFLVDKDNIRRQILVQINRKRKPTVKQMEALDQAIDEYVKDLYGTFINRAKRSKDYYYKTFGSPPSFKVLIKSLTGTGDVFEKVKQIRKERRDELKLTKAISDIFMRDKSISEESLRHLFDLGHIEGQSIAEQMVERALTKFSNVGDISYNSKELDTIISISISTKEKSGRQAGKQFIVHVEDESFTANQLKGSAEEKKFLNDVRKILGKFIEKNSNWATQGGSRSALDIVMAELLTTAKKSKATRVSKIKSKSEESSVKVTKTIKSKRAKGSIMDMEDIQVGNMPVTTQKTDRTNWSSIISIINKQLESRLIKNMRIPALQNRTGQFASSAKVLSVAMTNEGYPSFVFDYQRNPYDVFDRSIGKSPWNTPGRDPKTLIDKSIREIVQELAIGRFYTRRA